MKSTRFPVLLLGIILPVYFLCAGCKAGRPLRKTLPDQFTSHGIYEPHGFGSGGDTYILPGLPFYAVDTTIDGKECTAIYLRNPGFDSTAFNIIHSYEPFAGSLLDMMADQGIKSVLIDFCQQEDPVKESRADFRVSGTAALHEIANAALSVDIVFRWDENSASRAAGFMNELKGSALLAVKDLTNKNPGSPAGNQDCFNRQSVGFDDEK